MSASGGKRQGGLRADALKLWHVLAVGIAYMGLALSIYFNVGFIESLAGPICSPCPSRPAPASSGSARSGQ